MTISKIFMICNAYESGMGNGLSDHHVLNKNLFGDKEHQEAYEIGFELGRSRRDEYRQQKQKDKDETN